MFVTGWGSRDELKAIRAQSSGQTAGKEKHKGSKDKPRGQTGTLLSSQEFTTDVGDLEKPVCHQNSPHTCSKSHRNKGPAGV